MVDFLCREIKLFKQAFILVLICTFMCTN